MDDVRGDFLGPPHGTTPAVAIANKISQLDPFDFGSNENVIIKQLLLFPKY